jgi:hypothetical protein
MKIDPRPKASRFTHTIPRRALFRINDVGYEPADARIWIWTNPFMVDRNSTLIMSEQHDDHVGDMDEHWYL